MTSSVSVSSSQELIRFAHWLAGDFSNHQQAYNHPTLYAHIHVLWRPLPWEFFQGIGFYSEQVYDYDLWSPYRQGVHRLVDRGDRIYIENYSLQDSILYAGSARELSILQTITPQVIQRRYNCSMVFQWDGNCYRGSVEPGNKCLIHRKGHQTYLVSEVELTETTWKSLDRGMEVKTHQQIWGSTEGALEFEKITSFAQEVPTENLGL
ncbi:MAG: chromophore lyase CpcT/CpeT [Roseofilum sp. SBFL]|uniref:chromophore lyase CpcT/CpeT n=1 Tax=unclassified Roseofilum TaxID=2620099 RepID=UPI001B10BBBB|nr:MULTISPECIES: chromophore lyase CpcT/CpeT [unclassified Roseofilum]MBP0014546.1 chromophore lyase CpcT/CpeT [Roseofilum sp. SID3]MBP0026101.1 chromophore lyase CpcT/CpeT [Roseofilum sp. SID2]MBP0038437.1 chromophore lyase CpcT/CpeT [Roseofilum sp. SID1]MBP0040881.1 chromophore lyase CpcT/CpeT [Roseofilum sp. SBFL]